MFERFTERARQVVVLAQDEARALKHDYIGTEHLLLGLLREEEGLAARVLETLGVELEEVRDQVARIVGQGEHVATGQIPFTPRAKAVLELSLREALALGHNYIGTEHVLLGIARENDGMAVRVLREVGVDVASIRDELLRLLSGVGREQPAEPPPLRWEYGVRTLVGPTETWPEQLTAWRREGWELLTVVKEDDQHQALLERRVARNA
jgi:ATP-dependent Clp protease ATP-binding subunit ClpC